MKQHGTTVETKNVNNTRNKTLLFEMFFVLKSTFRVQYAAFKDIPAL